MSLSTDPQTLRNEIAERAAKLVALEVPQSPEAAAKLAKDDPEKFNELYEAGAIGPELLGAPIKEEDDHE